MSEITVAKLRGILASLDEDLVLSFCRIEHDADGPDETDVLSVDDPVTGFCIGDISFVEGFVEVCHRFDCEEGEDGWAYEHKRKSGSRTWVSTPFKWADIT